MIETSDQEGRRVVFVVEPNADFVILGQSIDGSPEGYRGRFTAREAADLGAALLMASGALHYKTSD